MSDLTLTLETSTTKVIPPVPVGERRPLLTPLPEPGHFLMVLDNTSLEKWKRCAVAAQYYLVLGREAHAKNAALTFGGALHEGLDKFHRLQFEADNETEYSDSDAITARYGIPAQDLAIRNYFQQNPTPPDSYRTVETALQVMSHYRRRCDPDLFPDYQWEIQSDEQGPLIERAFELPLGVIEVGAGIEMPWLTAKERVFVLLPKGNIHSPTFVSHIHLAWSGRIDLVARIHDVLRVVDHKTTSIDGDQFIQSFQLACQTLGYVWAARQLWPHLDVKGFCLNALRLKKPNVGATDLMATGSRGGEAPLKFFRNYFDYSPARIDQWQKDTIAHVSDFIHCLVRNHFPPNDRHCYDKFGECPYHTVCVLDDPEVRDRFIRSEAFRPVTWNPVAKESQ